MLLKHYGDGTYRSGQIQYSLPAPLEKSINKMSRFQIAYIGISLILFPISVIAVFMLSDVVFMAIALSLAAISAFPASIITAQIANNAYDRDQNKHAKQKIIDNVSEPLISTDGSTIRFAYEFIDTELSTTDTLTLTPDPDQPFMSISSYQSETGHKDPALTVAVEQFVKNQRLSDDEIYQRVESAHRLAEHNQNDRALSFSEKFYQNVNQPVDTPYYRSLTTMHKNIAEDLKMLEQQQENNINENKNIVNALSNTIEKD